MRLDLAALDPAPTKVVANLPYGVAATVILRAVESLPEVTTQVAMVQREVGERLAGASPGSAAYGAPSVLAQLACEVRVHPPGVAQRVPSRAERRLRPRRPAPHRPAARAGAAARS